MHWEMPLTVGSAGSGDHKELRFGFDDKATDGIDLDLGEREVPPWPPSEVLEARLAGESSIGLYLDLRGAEPRDHTFEVIWQAGIGGYPVEIAWESDLIPDGIDLVLTDNLDGSFVGSVDMRTSSSVLISEEQAFVEGLLITASLRQAGLGENVAVTRFALRTGTPNPFALRTAIGFDIPKESAAEIAVYDATGRLVRVLHSGEAGKGSHTVVWDGCDESGVAVSAGVYFCRMEAEGYKKTRKLLLLR
jgi:hypothetical protein